MSNKRYFKVTLSGYGGEFVMGKVSEEFVQYWAERDDSDALFEHLSAIDWGDEDSLDPDSPAMYEDGENCTWHECDDIEHLNGAYADSYAYVAECDEEWEQLDNTEEERFDLDERNFSCHEVYSSGENGDVPVLMVHSAEKGTFGEVRIETDGEDFDVEKFRTITAETDIAEFVSAVVYLPNSEELEIDFDYCDTRGKSMEARVGWVNMDWIEPRPDAEAIKEAVEELIEWESEEFDDD